MVKKDKKATGMPEWICNYPLSSDMKKPILVRKKDKKPLIYGKGKHLDSTPLYISTNRIYLGEYTVPPGEYFDPPDLHTGDECYYCLEGVAHIFNPVNGDVVELNPGDALLIPEGTWHVGYNFGDKNFRLVALIAPSIWSEGDMGIKVNFEGKQAFYKSEDE